MFVNYILVQALVLVSNTNKVKSSKSKRVEKVHKNISIEKNLFNGNL